jgi:S-formylglutathione hydrolase FrmB
MALMEVHYSSFAMGTNITLNVFVPTPGSSEAITDMNQSRKYDYEHGLPVLYLLHGAYGDAFSWIRYSNIDRYAQDRGIVVVMASAENSFYQDLKYGRKYYTFFTEELPTFIQNVFPVSKDRDKTFVAGFSMGGYGAWYLGLRRPDLFSKADWGLYNPLYGINWTLLITYRYLRHHGACRLGTEGIRMGV